MRRIYFSSDYLELASKFRDVNRLKDEVRLQVPASGHVCLAETVVRFKENGNVVAVIMKVV